MMFFSCSKKTIIQQVDSDLVEMLERKVVVQNLEITKINTFTKDALELDSVYFDCNLLLTDHLFSDDFKFNKGMSVSAHNNVFVYDKSKRLVALKFGRTSLNN